MKLAQNFEMAMYIAQATGSCIVTDSVFRWRELREATRPRLRPMVANLSSLASAISAETFKFPKGSDAILRLSAEKLKSSYQPILRDAFRYLRKIKEKGPKPNFEANIIARFKKEHSRAQGYIEGSGLEWRAGRISCAFPEDGIQHNHVNRLLLMSSSEHHLPNVPMAFLIEPCALRLTLLERSTSTRPETVSRLMVE